MNLSDLIVANLAMPGREGNVQTPDLRLFELLDCVNFPRLHPLATLTRNIDPNPAILRFAAVVHATNDELISADQRPLLEAQKALLLVFQIEVLCVLWEGRFKGFEHLPRIGLCPESEPINCGFLNHERSRVRTP
jgi:hypothetical protein